MDLNSVPLDLNSVPEISPMVARNLTADFDRGGDDFVVFDDAVSEVLDLTQDDPR
jgi:hypothetical protein